MSALLCGAFLSCLAQASDRRAPLKGLPFARLYSFDEIGDISQGAHLSVDRMGRLVAVQDGAFLVLDDQTWLDLGPKDENAVKIEHVVRDVDGTNYYGALGSCGVLSTTPDGRVWPRSFLPSQNPAWVKASTFTKILCRPEGIYFGGWNGVVFWNRQSHEVKYVEVPALSAIFTLDHEVFVSSHSKHVLRLDVSIPAVVEADHEVFDDSVIDYVAPIGGGRAIISNTGRRLFIYRDGRMTPLPGRLGGYLEGKVSAVEALADGNIAVAVLGKGLYIISAQGEVVAPLTSPEYRRVVALAASEPGVVWASTETGVAKVIYGTPVTWFGQALGLPVVYPQFVLWQNKLVVASNGGLFQPAAPLAGEPSHFQPITDRPISTWGIATWHEWLLVGCPQGVFAKNSERSFQQILPHMATDRLVMLPSGVCLAIGAYEIAALKFESGSWRECAARVKGVGYPSVVHASSTAAWIELGADRAARVSFDGEIKMRVFETLPWPKSGWVHVSVIDDVAILNGAEAGRIFFDEKTERIVEHPAIESVLNQAPYWIVRLEKDSAGTLWASHAHGLFTMIPQNGRYVVDNTTFRILSEHIPFVHTLPGPDVWVSNGSSLYHVSGTPADVPRSIFRPILVSVRDEASGRELLTENMPVYSAVLPYAQNSLALRFFAGSYASRHAPAYEFSVNGGKWSSLEATSLLRLTDLHEGQYQVGVRLLDDRGPVGPVTTVRFAISPPWYRTWYAFATYALASAIFVYLLIRFALSRASARNIVLEKTVAERTDELKTTMRKLQQETRTAATLAERNRLAGEIHDSLEQSFSALALQLETVAGLAPCPPEIRGGLSVARNMVAFSRNEIRHAVWDLHSPMLDSGGLEPALRNIVTKLVPASIPATISTEGAPRSLGSTVEHHLLRIAQEAVANAVKHSAASHLFIRVSLSETDLTLSVADDGKGFEPPNVMAGGAGHFGLRSLRARAAKVGGVLDVQSKPGQGTRVQVRVPFANGQAI